MMTLIAAALAAAAPAPVPADAHAQHQGMAHEGKDCACCKDMAKDGGKKDCCAEHGSSDHAEHDGQHAAH